MYRLSVLMLLMLSLAACNNSNNSNTYSGSTNKMDTARVTNTTRGKELFDEKCSACHGLNGDNMSNGAFNLQVNTLDSIGIIQTIKNGKGTMPPFKDAMPDSDMAQIEMYVKTLRKS